MPKENYLEPIKEPKVTRAQIEALKRHQLTQTTGILGFYTLACSCGARGPRRYRTGSRAQGWAATQWVIRHSALVMKDLGMLPPVLFS